MLKIERKAREEADRKQEIERKEWEEAERRRRDEETRLKKLEQQVALWIKSEQIRHFVLAVESAVAAKEMPENEKKAYEGWMAWARSHADQIDPINRSLYKR